MTFQVELVSPESISYSGEAEMIIARTVEGGDIAFQPGHVPFIGVLSVWSVEVIRPDGERDIFASDEDNEDALASLERSEVRLRVGGAEV